MAAKVHHESALPECVSKYKCPKATSKSQKEKTQGIELVKITNSMHGFDC